MGTSARRGAGIVAAAVVALASAGCGYSIRPPFDPNVRTIYVPIFRTTNTFRRDLNFQLTKAIIDEINRRTPYRVVNSYEQADAVLEGTLDIADKNIFVENPNNLPRQLQAILTVNARLYDNRVPDEKFDKIPTTFTENVSFYPELGETTQLAYTKAINNIAAQIVGAMEQPWQAGPLPPARPR
ncbi:MAG TPA: LptE family protein [Isosphaeraceae bacterium]|jgi:hypothetical protein|nr:LptE family protein [Isosphaeraceae bacterium]